MANKADIVRLEKQVTNLSDALAKLNTPDDWKRLILILRRPGWTTLADLIFVSAILEAMQAQAAALAGLKAKLLKGSEAVSAG
jgi:hypothetical protein